MPGDRAPQRRVTGHGGITFELLAVAQGRACQRPADTVLVEQAAIGTGGTERDRPVVLGQRQYLGRNPAAIDPLRGARRPRGRRFR